MVDGDAVRAELTDAGVQEQAAAIVASMATDASVVAASAPDDVTARVTVAIAWHPPIFSPFVPDGVALESTSTSRTALR
ncbi:hypothetical protein [Microbacterium sp. CH12i]|uniref:hypothetical protein n=1 Tax=Microbacterium sp. CH12i TaxID=1479651 RepID=UPI001F3A9F13|nr:hypothetical protein [Microbacterium sp. CH12i]